VKITRRQLQQTINEALNYSDIPFSFQEGDINEGFSDMHSRNRPGVDPTPEVDVGRQYGGAGTRRTPSNAARVLHDAIAGFGTKEEKIEHIFGVIGEEENPEKYLRDVADAYMREFDSDLGRDLRDDLSDVELRDLVYAPWLGQRQGGAEGMTDALEILGIRIGAEEWEQPLWTGLPHLGGFSYKE